MFEKDAFQARERAMEDEFFHRVDEKLREELRKSMEREESREALAAATGLSDHHLLDALLDAGVQATTLTALTLVPAIYVAWADGTVADAEREAIMKAAANHGIRPNELAWKLLDSWLTKKPRKVLWETWQQYAGALQQSLPPADAATLSDEVQRLATVVAEAAGGVLGIGKVSKDEHQVLDQIKQTLAGGAES